MSHYKSKRFGLILFLFIAAVFAVSGCGMGGSNSVCCSNNASPFITGTAAGGAPIATATISVKDKNGTVRTAPTNATGDFSIDVSGLTGPYLMKVTKGAVTLYSVASITGTVNIHQFTDVIVRTWYRFKGTTADVVFASTGTIQIPTQLEMAAMEAATRSLIADWLEQHGVTPVFFNLFTTPFSANSTAFDKVLDLVKITISGGTITITPVDPSNGNAQGDPIATLPDNFDLTTNPILSAVIGVNAAIGNFKTAVNANSATLTAANIAQFYDPAFLNNGLTGAQEQTQTAAYLLNGSITSWAVKNVIAFNPTTSTIVVRTIATYTDYTGLAHNNEVVGIDVFKKDNVSGNWRLYGNQRIAMIDVQSGVKRSIGLNLVSTYTNIVPVMALAPTGTISSIIVSGPGLASPTTLAAQVPFVGDAAKDLFYIPNDNPLAGGVAQPLPGALYTFTITKADTTIVTYKDILPAGSGTNADANTLLMTNPTGHAISNATPGSVLNPTWTLPAAIFVNQVQLSGWTSDGVTFCWVQGTVSATKTTGAITLPATCGGNAVTIGALNVKAIGWGKRIAQLEYRFGN